jgi:hypothetical protein
VKPTPLEIPSQVPRSVDRPSGINVRNVGISDEIFPLKAVGVKLIPANKTARTLRCRAVQRAGDRQE